MNTPAHAIAGMLLLGARKRPGDLAAIAFGSVLPDLPMVFFYAVQRAWIGAGEAAIWSRAYYEPAWQHFFDLFNSLPLSVAGLIVARLLRARRSALVLAAMTLHALCDLPVHHDDAHRHLFPFSDWRFASPVSYWDPAHHGRAFALAELTLMLIGSAVLWRRHPERHARAIVAGIGSAYLLFAAFAIAVWL